MLAVYLGVKLPVFPEKPLDQPLVVLLNGGGGVWKGLCRHEDPLLHGAEGFVLPPKPEKTEGTEKAIPTRHRPMR